MDPLPMTDLLPIETDGTSQRNREVAKNGSQIPAKS
jgi:hypothetical protein